MGSGASALMVALGAMSTACYSGVSADADGETDSAGAEAGEAGTAGGSAADGTAGDGSGSDEPSPLCLAELQPRPLQRLTPAQTRNTLRDLFGDPELEITYDDQAPIITESGVRQLRSGAEDILARRDHWSEEVYGCETDGEPDDACAEAFIQRFGARVFRRPLHSDDTDWLMSVYESAVYGEQLSFSDSMDVVLAAMLQAPAHVYVIEDGTVAPDAPQGVRALTDHELASRLSYFLWDTMPDAELQRAADAGELLTAEGLEAQVDRMMTSERTEGRLQLFVSEWLHLDGVGLRFPLEDLQKDTELYPEFDPALQDAMRVELEALVQRAFFGEEEANLDRLFLDTDAYVNASLAQLYGVPGPADDDTWEWVQLPEAERAGVLTRAAFLSVQASQRVQSPVYRGVYVLEEVLCGHLGEPPPNANDTPVEGGDDPIDGPMTVRQSVEARTMEGDCAVCHALINPTGYLFEHYDAIGRWQEDEVHSGLEIDASGELTIGDVAGPMDDAVGLSKALAQSSDARECFAERWVSQALDTELDALDECTREEVVDAFTQTGDVRALVASIVRSAAFRHIRIAGE